MSADLVLEALRWRYATKAFDPSVPVSDADWFVLTEAFRLSPSSYGVQPWKLIDVVSPEVREALAQAAPLNTTKIMTCSRLAVLANLRHISPEYLEAYYCDLATTRGFERAQIDGFATMVSADVAAKGPAGQANWAVAQTYIALGLMGSAAAVMHIDLSPMEGIDRAAGTDSAPATAPRARNRSCSSRPLKPRNARASGARRACRSALPPHGPPSCNR